MCPQAPIASLLKNLISWPVEFAEDFLRPNFLRPNFLEIEGRTSAKLFARVSPYARISLSGLFGIRMSGVKNTAGRRENRRGTENWNHESRSPSNRKPSQSRQNGCQETGAQICRHVCWNEDFQGSVNRVDSKPWFEIAG